MTDRQLRQYQMLLRLRDFGTAHANRFAEGTLAAEAFGSIDNALTQLNTYAMDRLGVRRQSAKARSAARAALVNMMEAISRTARGLQDEEPGFPNTFLMPERRSAQTLLTAARLFARDVEPFADRFVKHAFGDTFPENFNSLLRAYEQAVHGREAGKGLSAAARANIEAALAAGLAAARRLDIIVGNTMGHDPVVVAEWERNRRVGYRRTQTSAAPAIPTPSVTSPETTPTHSLVPSSEPTPDTTRRALVPEDLSSDVPDDVRDVDAA
jgi:hypothetical protein